MRILFPLLTLVFLFTSTVYSEVPQYIDVLMMNAKTSTGDGTPINVHNANTVRLDVQIAGVATVDFRIAGPGNFGPYAKVCTPDDGSARATGTSVSGVFYCQIAAGNVFIATVSSYTSGTVTVVGRATTAF